MNQRRKDLIEFSEKFCTPFGLAMMFPMLECVRGNRRLVKDEKITKQKTRKI